ncbi:hypothetical protein VTL71DRAFT_3982 [Oculimacula yallundae]|uniref:Uncharacterized protein n=1 Tax=Oculimacula yallundae TaxID=86028 RepID=A0ABR4C592_9HELO
MSYSSQKTQRSKSPNSTSNRTPVPIHPTTPPAPFLTGTLPPPPSNLQKQIHNKWLPTYVHSAQCDGCHTKKHAVLHRCLSCTLQFCKKCMMKAREKGSGHEYVEEGEEGGLDWDVGRRPRVFRDHGRRKLEGIGIGGRAGVGSGVKGFGGGSIETVMSGEEKYRRQSNKHLLGGPKSASEYGRGQADLLEGNDDELESDDDFYIPVIKRRRWNEYSSTQTSIASLRGGEHQFNYQKSDGDRSSSDYNFDQPSTASISRYRPNGTSAQPSTASLRFHDHALNDKKCDGSRHTSTLNFNQASSASVGRRPINGRQSIAYKQQNQHRQSTSIASAASSRPKQAYSHHQEPFSSRSPSNHPSSPHPHQPSSTHLTPSTTFSSAVSAVLHSQKEEHMYTESLHHRRAEFEEYCRQAWMSDPVLCQLREQGRAEKARELFGAAKEMLGFARGLSGA